MNLTLHTLDGVRVQSETADLASEGMSFFVPTSALTGEQQDSYWIGARLTNGLRASGLIVLLH